MLLRTEVRAPVIWLLVIVCVLGCEGAPAAVFYVSPSGADTNSGSLGAPFFTISKASTLSQPGDTIWVRGGTFMYSNMITISNAGTALSPIKLWAYTNEHPFLDFSSMIYVGNSSTNRGFFLTTNEAWWHIKGLEVYRAGDNGMKIEGNNNTVENCSFHHCRDTGLQIGLQKNSEHNDGTSAASNLVLNCDAYLNYDPPDGGDADGLDCKLCPGPSNVFRGCRSWENSDDGMDFYQSEYAIVLEDCWTWHNGDGASFGVGSVGNGNGFKLGGNSTYGAPHVVKRCIAFNNHYAGSSAGRAYHQNDNSDGITLINCLSFSNNFNYALNNDISESHLVENCVTFGGYIKNFTFNSTTIQISNTWNFSTNTLTASAADYLDLSEDAAKAPRNADGSLPNNGFGRLAAGSDLIDRGTNVGLPFTGAAPDLGPIEYSVVRKPTFDTSPGALKMTNGVLSMRLSGLTGHGPVIFYGSSNFSAWTPLYTNPPVTGTLQYLDANVGSSRQRFYRAVEQ